MLFAYSLEFSSRNVGGVSTMTIRSDGLWIVGSSGEAVRPPHPRQPPPETKAVLMMWIRCLILAWPWASVSTAHSVCCLSPTGVKLAVRGTRESGRNPVEWIGEGQQPPHQRSVRGTRETGNNPVERIGQGVKSPHQRMRLCAAYMLRAPGPGDGAERLGEGSEPPHQMCHMLRNGRTE